MRFGAGIWLFGQFVDRYATDAYGPPVSTLEAIDARGRGRRHRGARHQLSVHGGRDRRARCATRWRRNGHRAVVHHAAHLHARLPAPARSRTPTRRSARQALELCEEAVDVAKQLGAPTVKLWPGQDGFDFPLQVDYREVWRLALEGVSDGRGDGRRHPRRDRVQDQGAADAHELRRPRRARWSGSRRWRARTSGSSSTSATACSPRRRRRTRCTWSTTTAGCSRSRSTTTGASGTTTCPSARST